jgi:ABC-2 type transport system permease protein
MKMSALASLTKTEARLFVRDPMALFWGLAFPAGLLVIIGLVFPGAQDPSPDLGGSRLVDLYAPVALGLALATLGISVLPVILATARERGVLRRLATTPVHPARMVMAQLLVHLAVAVVSGILAVAIGVAFLKVTVPENLPGFILAFLLGAASMFGIGLLIGALAPTASSAQGIGLTVYFPLLFFAGVYFPREVMSDGLRQISDLTPSGAAVQALGDAWAGRSASASSLLVMAAFAIVTALVAIRFFRWE